LTVTERANCRTAISAYINCNENVNMKLIKITPNNGRGSLPIYLNSDEILRIDFGTSEHNPGCDITLKNGQVLSVFDKPKSIFDAVNHPYNRIKENNE